MAVTLTVNFNFPKPDPEANVDEELYRLQTTLDAIDAAMKTIADDAASRAGVDHNHPISDITGLAAALEGKMSASQTFLLDDLSDVAGASGAANGYILVKSTTGWVPSTAIAALGTHGHLIGEVSGLAEALASKAEASAVATALGSKADAAAMATGLSGKLDRTGGTISGATVINNNLEIGGPANYRLWFHLHGVKKAGFALGNDGALYYSDHAGQNHFTIGPSGAIWTQQLGDLNTRIEDRAMAWGNHFANQWSAVANAMAGMSVGGVGSLVFGCYAVENASITYGATFAGSSIRPTGISVVTDTNLATATGAASMNGAAVLSGTWRSLGQGKSGSSRALVTNFVRIF